MKVFVTGGTSTAERHRKGSGFLVRGQPPDEQIESKLEEVVSVDVPAEGRIGERGDVGEFVGGGGWPGGARLFRSCRVSFAVWLGGGCVCSRGGGGETDGDTE